MTCCCRQVLSETRCLHENDVDLHVGALSVCSNYVRVPTSCADPLATSAASRTLMTRADAPPQRMAHRGAFTLSDSGKPAAWPGPEGHHASARLCEA
jgi:hypothetical protein